jgi:hypothetical protein
LMVCIKFRSRLHAFSPINHPDCISVKISAHWWSIPRKNLSSPIILISNSDCMHLEIFWHNDALADQKMIPSIYIWTVKISFLNVF